MAADRCPTCGAKVRTVRVDGRPVVVDARASRRIVVDDANRQRGRWVATVAPHHTTCKGARRDG